jgi:beta-lactamase regulating signal transducer with metallopeptidase domain
MSQEVFMRGLFSGLMALVFAWVVFSRYDDEIGTEVSENERQKYLPYIPGTLLPGFLIAITILATYFYGFSGAAKMTLSACFTIFLHISLYYLVLLLILPFLRKVTSARACAMLWLVPNYLYVIHQSYMELPSPLIVITAKGNLTWILFAIWLAGFAAVLVWKIIEHLVFRHHVLRDTCPITDPDVLSVWNTIIEDSRFKRPKFKLVTSPNVTTPLTIGLNRRATRVVLPEKKYSKEDLELILRHEIVHIGREDAWNKFFMVFCAAMCWFNPLMWIAMRKSADDMELSCDETVLLGADDATRKQYAILLLDTAGDERGFTTCLSATANAMRYRLQNITKPVKRRSGALIVGAVFFILCMTSGYVALAYEGNSGAQLIYQCDDYNSYVIRSVSLKDDEFATNYEIADEEAFHSYLAGLTLYELTGNYSFNDSERCFTYLMDTHGGTMAVLLYDNAVKTVWLHSDAQAEYYYVPEGIDWDYIETVIIPHPAMNVYLKEPDSAYPDDLGALLQRLWRTEDGEKRLVYENVYPEGEYHGIFGNAYRPNEATFDFSYDLAEPFTVRVESWDYSTSYTVSQTDLLDGITMELPEYSAHYTVYASFYDENGNLYEAEFWFNLGDIYSN